MTGSIFNNDNMTLLGMFAVILLGKNSNVYYENFVSSQIRSFLRNVCNAYFQFPSITSCFVSLCISSRFLYALCILKRQGVRT
jgi:hypothetical protein